MARFLIPKYKFEELNKKLNWIRNKGADINLEIINDDVNYDAPELGRGRVIPCVEVEVSGGYIINGWRFITTIQHAHPENIIRLADYSFQNNIPEKYRTTEKECEHCHLRRDRNDTYLVFNEDTLEWKQVGRSCLRNYTSGLDAEVCASFSNVMSEIRRLSDALNDGDLEAFRNDSQNYNNKSYFNMEDVRKKAYKYVKDKGYVPQKTKISFWTDLMDDKIEGEASDNEIEEMTEWLSSLNDSNNDYIRNIKAVWNKNNFENRDSGLLTSAIAYFLKEKSRTERFNNIRNRNLNNSQNEFAGNIGDKVTLTISEDPVVLFTRTAGSYYHSFEYPVYKLIGEDGKVYIWGCSSDIDLNKGDILSGTIKKLNERPSGEKQTELTRCKVIGHKEIQNRGKGFFQRID